MINCGYKEKIVRFFNFCQYMFQIFIIKVAKFNDTNKRGPKNSLLNKSNSFFTGENIAYSIVIFAL